MKLRLLLAGLLAMSCLPAAQASAGEATPQYCDHFEGLRARAAPATGKLIDPITRLAGVDLQCAEQVIHFKQEVVLPERELKGDWLVRHRAFWSKTHCQPGSRSEAAIRSGWTVTTTITTVDGGRYRFTAKCSEQVAALDPDALRD